MDKMDCIECKGLKRVHHSIKISCINSNSCPECLPCKDCRENLPSPLKESPKKKSSPQSCNSLNSNSDMNATLENTSSNDKLNRSSSQSISKREKMSDLLKKIDNIKDDYEEGKLKNRNLVHYQSLEALSTRAMTKTRRQEFESLKIKTKLSNQDKDEHHRSKTPSHIHVQEDYHRSKASSLSESDVNGLKSADSTICLSSNGLNRYAEKKEKMILSSGALYSSKADLSTSSLNSHFSDYDIPLKFKDWIPILEADSKSKTKKILKTKITDSPISMKSLLGHATQKALDLLMDRMVWWGAHYEELKIQNHWNSSQNITLLKLQDLSPGKDVGNNELVYRVLDVFQDERIQDLEYEYDLILERDVILCGIPKSLVDALIFPLEQDSLYTLQFMSCHRFFLRLTEFLDSLIAWYNVDIQDAQKSELEFLRKNKRKIQTKVIHILIYWIRHHWQDFMSSPDLHKELSLFLHYLSKVSYGDHQKVTQSIREQWLNWYTFIYVPPFCTQHNIMPVSEPSQPRPCGIMDSDLEYFACHLTAIDHLYFRQIKQETYLSLMIHSIKQEGAGFNAGFKLLMEYFSWFRTLSYYVSSVIHKEETIKGRSTALKKFIKVAKYLKSLGNYNGLFAILYGLKRPQSLVAVASWDLLKQRYYDDFKECHLIMDPKDSFKNYWTELKNVKPPAVPCLVIHLFEMMDLCQSFDTHLPAVGNEEPRVNFRKFRDLYSIISELEMFYKVSFTGSKFGDRETQALLVQHIKSNTTFDGDETSISPDSSWNTMAMDKAAETVKKIGSIIGKTRKSLEI